MHALLCILFSMGERGLEAADQNRCPRGHKPNACWGCNLRLLDEGGDRGTSTGVKLIQPMCPLLGNGPTTVSGSTSPLGALPQRALNGGLDPWRGGGGSANLGRPILPHDFPNPFETGFLTQIGGRIGPYFTLLHPLVLHFSSLSPEATERGGGQDGGVRWCSSTRQSDGQRSS